MSNFLTSPLVILTAVILLPLVPAFILFKSLPNSAEMDGPFQGLKIKLGGAFAGYFALVILILSTKNVWNPVAAYQVWTVTGRITDTKGALIAPLVPGDISLLPSPLSESGGLFSIDIPVKPGQGGDTVYPILAITHPGYSAVDVSLDPASAPPQGVQVNFNTTGRTVQINNLQLQLLTPYQPAAPLNALTTAPTSVPQTQPAGVHE